MTVSYLFNYESYYNGLITDLVFAPQRYKEMLK